MERRVLLTPAQIPPLLVTSTSDTPVAPTPDVPNPLTLRQAITEADLPVAVFTGTLTSGSPSVTGISSTTGLVAGRNISGTGIPSGTTILSVSSSTATITLSANATASGTQSLTALTGPVTIDFDLVPKNIPGVVNFDLTNQVWTIDVNNNVPLPPITGQVTIDGYSQKFVTPVDNPNIFQKVVLTGSPTGGSFTLTFEGDTTGPIPFNATAAQVQAALEALPNIGPGNAEATLGPVNTVGVVVDLYGAAPAPIQLMTGNATNLQGLSLVSPPSVTISAVSADITSVPNALTVGFNAQVRVIIDGTNPISEPSDFPGLTIDSPHNVIRGLSIHSFSAGISIQGPDATGNLIQGNYLGQYLVFPNPSINPAPSFLAAGPGNTVGIEIASQTSPLPSNNAVGGVSPETHNAIAGNLAQGVMIDAGSNYNQVVGNLIGVLEQDPTLYYQVGNGAEGVLIESESNLIGGDAVGATNVISANRTDGIHIEGPGALDNRVEANYIGTDIDGSFLLGQGDPGNGQDGIFIDDAPDNQIGIPGGSAGVGNVAANIISDNSGAGLSISGTSATGNIIQGNVIGTNISGTSALGNAQPGVVLDTADNTVGGTTAGAGNLISANLSGVLVSGLAASGNLIAGNFIGTNGTGTYVLGNSFDGVDIEGASDNTVGGQVAGARNLISGNEVGVLVTGTTAFDNRVLGNDIGTDVTGLLVLGNEEEGVGIDGASDNTIGGQVTGARNLISGNNIGVLITGMSAINNLVLGNDIGTDATGLVGLGNEGFGQEGAGAGVEIDGASDTTIGGQVAAARNLISGNNLGVLITGTTAIDNLVLGNYIGTDVTGLGALGNEEEGVRIEKGSLANTIGGTSPTATNVISANQWGVTITDPGTNDNVVQGNLIGTGADGLTALGNEIDGVLVTNGAANNLIGGLGTGPGNTIAFNGADGVQINGPNTNGNGILSNRIFANGGLGIDLVDGGNNLQPAPVLTSLTITSTGVVVQGTLSSMPGTSYLIQFFLHAPGNSSSDGELLGSTMVLTDANGNASFSVALAFNITVGEGIMATATNPGNNTSEFSAVVVNPPAVLVFSMANYTVNQAAGVAVITVDREGGGGVVTVFYATAGGTAVPGLDYTPVSGTLTFGLGGTVQNFTVPILDDPALQTDKTVNLVIAAPTGGATLGVPSLAILTIVPRPPGSAPPAVTGVRLITNRHQIVTGIVVTFSKLLNPTTAVNLLNYNYSVTTAGRNHVFGARDNLLIPILTAVYNPSHLSVTLTLGRGIHPPTPFRFAINQLTDVPGAGIGVSDLAGNLLSGADNGVAGGAYVVILRGNAGGIVRFTPEAAVTQQSPRSVAAIDAVLEAGNVAGTRVARAARGRRVRLIDRRR